MTRRPLLAAAAVAAVPLVPGAADAAVATPRSSAPDVKTSQPHSYPASTSNRSSTADRKRRAERLRERRQRAWDRRRDRAVRIRERRAREHRRDRAARIRRAERRKLERIPNSTKTHLRSIAACESHNDPNAIGGGGAYRGLFQFSMQTWRSVGGKGDPASATRAEQYFRAAKLLRSQGASHWPVCG